MAGHSFGGYIVGNYALKYHMNIKKLILLSPVGLRQPNLQQTYEELDKENNLNDEDTHPAWFALLG